MRPIGSGRILRKGTLHRRNETKMSDRERMEGQSKPSEETPDGIFHAQVLPSFATGGGRKNTAPHTRKA